MALFKNKKEKDPSKERMKRVGPVAKEIISIVAASEFNVGDLTEADNENYTKLARKILQLILDKNLRFNDKEILFQLVLQPFDQLAQIVKTSLGQSFDKALEKALGKEYGEVTLGDLDEILKTKVAVPEGN